MDFGGSGGAGHLIPRWKPLRASGDVGMVSLGHPVGLLRDVVGARHHAGRQEPRALGRAEPRPGQCAAGDGSGSIDALAERRRAERHAAGHGARAAGRPAGGGLFSGGAQWQSGAGAGAAAPVALGGGGAGGAGAGATHRHGRSVFRHGLP